MSIKPLGISLESHRIFRQVSDHNDVQMGELTEIFNRVLTPLYGSQEKALKQIKEGKDRRGYLLYEEDDPVGVLVFKTVLSDEFKEFGVEKSIEIKSLFVNHPRRNAGLGFGSELIKKVNAEAEKLHLGHKGIHVTVSEDKQESLFFFQKKGFKIVHTWDGKYNQGKKEHLLFYSNVVVESGLKLAASSSNEESPLAMHKVSLLNTSTSTQVVHRIQKAHLDDIHALVKLGDGSIISGSKDNCIYKWSKEGKLLYTVQEVEPDQETERSWITAIIPFNKNYWISGYRNGEVALWKTDGGYVRDIHMRLPSYYSPHISQPLNKRRVNCLATGLDPERPSFFAGFPTMFDEFNFLEEKTEYFCPVSKNDWVYCIEPLNAATILAVRGCNIDRYSLANTGWKRAETVLSEKSSKQASSLPSKRQRPFISSLTALQKEPSLFAISDFSNRVRVINIETKAVQNDWQEHRDKVWKVVSIAPNFIASAGEDRSIKLWDTREAKSVRSVSGHMGPVTELLAYDENLLLAGTCSKDSYLQNSGAEILYYDLRF